MALALLDAPEDSIRGEAFNVGSAAQNYLIRDLAEVVRNRFPACDVTFAEGAGSDPRSYRVDFEKLRGRFPSFECAWSAERGTDELADAYAAAGLTLEGFEGPRYVRLRQLKKLLDAGVLGDGLRRARPLDHGDGGRSTEPH